MRKEVEKMIKVANSPQLIKLVNPARMHLSDEEELMVVLNLQEPPSVDVSVDQTEETKQEAKPTKREEVKATPQPPAPAKSKAKASRKEQQ